MTENQRDAAGSVSSDTAQVYIIEQRAIGKNREAIKAIDYLARHNRLPETVDWPAVAGLLGLTNFANQGDEPR